MSSELVLRYVQIGFYASAILVAWLTYFSAKRTLLNSVNTEYRKRVMDRLSAVSQALLGEGGEGNGDTWTRDVVVEVKERAGKINEAFIAKTDWDTIEWADSRTVDFSFILSGRPEYAEHLMRLAFSWDSDPFIPDHLREPVCSYLVEYSNGLWEASDETLREHLRALRAADRQPDFEGIRAALHHFLTLVEQRRLQGSDYRERVRRFRYDIQVYLESFDPLLGRQRRRHSRQLRLRE